MQHLNFQKIGRQFSQVAPFILLLSDMILSKKNALIFLVILVYFACLLFLMTFLIFRICFHERWIC
jgi:hypothetical protein